MYHAACPGKCLNKNASTWMLYSCKLTEALQKASHKSCSVRVQSRLQHCQLIIACCHAWHAMQRPLLQSSLTSPSTTDRSSRHVTRPQCIAPVAVAQHANVAGVSDNVVIGQHCILHMQTSQVVKAPHLLLAVPIEAPHCNMHAPSTNQNVGGSHCRASKVL